MLTVEEKIDTESYDLGVSSLEYARLLEAMASVNASSLPSDSASVFSPSIATAGASRER